MVYSQYMQDIKLVSFDLDGTIITNNSWVELNTAFGIDPEIDWGLYDDFIAGKITYQEWLDTLSNLWKAHPEKLTREYILSHMRYDFRPHIHEVIESLHARGYKTMAIISGAPDIVADDVASKLGIHYARSTNIATFKDGVFDSFVDNGDETRDGKPNLLQEICTIENITLQQCVHIGDSMTDVPLFDATGNGITFSSSKQSVRDRARWVIDDLLEMLDILE